MINWEIEDAEIAHFYSNCEDLISVDKCKPNSLVVFDDCVNIKQQHFIKIISLEDAIKIFLAST